MLLRMTRTGAVALAVGLLASTPATLSAQINPPDTPASSPLWWTLDPEIEPAQLRARHLDRLATHERYAQAVEAGLAEPLAPDALERLEFYLNGRQHPELLPMWNAFAWFAKTSDSSRGEERTAARLAGHGVSHSGIERIQAEAHALLQESWRIEDETRRAAGELRRMVDAASERGSAGEAREAWKAGDARALSAATGRPRVEIERHLDQARGAKHWATAVASKLVELRQALDASDWASLRHMLKHDLAPKVTSRTIRDPEG